MCVITGMIGVILWFIISFFLGFLLTGGSEVSSGISYIIFFGVPIAMLIYPFMVNKVLNSKGNKRTSFNRKDTIIISENESKLLKNESVEQERILEGQNIHTKVSVPTVSSYTKKTTVKERIMEAKSYYKFCTTADEIVTKYIEITPKEDLFNAVELSILKYYLKYHGEQTKHQNWDNKRVDLLVKSLIKKGKSRTDDRVVDESLQCKQIQTENKTGQPLFESFEISDSLSDERTHLPTDISIDRISLDILKTSSSSSINTIAGKSTIEDRISKSIIRYQSCNSALEVAQKYIDCTPKEQLFNAVEVSILKRYLQRHFEYSKDQKWDNLIVQTLISDTLQLSRNVSSNVEFNDEIQNTSTSNNTDNELNNYKIRTPLDTEQFESHEIDNKTGKDEIYFPEQISKKDDYKAEPYVTFDNMRRIADIGNTYFDRCADIFYKQAKFMENYEDDFSELCKFEMYFPTYMSMNDSQLRTYFTWRSNVRKGIISETSLSYVFIYIYELLHEIGVESVRDGYRRLCVLSNEYRKYDRRLEKYLNLWIHDYTIYNYLFKEISDEEKLIFFNESFHLEALLKAVVNGDSSKFTLLLNNFSNYNITKSVFYRDYKEDYCNVLLIVFKELDLLYVKNQKNALVDKIFGKINSSSWSPYESAVFSNYKNSYNVSIHINEFEYYSLRSGSWTRYHIPSYKTDKAFVTEIIKGTDAYMRTMFEYPRQIKFKPSTQTISTTIEKMVTLYCEENNKIGYCARKKAAKKNGTIEVDNIAPLKVEIDITKLDKIRKDSLRVQEKLIVSGDLMEINSEAIKSSSSQIVNNSVINNSMIDSKDYEDEWRIWWDMLSEIQKVAIGIIATDENVTEQLLSLSIRNNGILIEVLLEEINEMALEYIGDNIVETTDTQIYIYEDYIENISNVIRR